MWRNTQITECVELSGDDVDQAQRVDMYVSGPPLFIRNKCFISNAFWKRDTDTITAHIVQKMREVDESSPEEQDVIQLPEESDREQSPDERDSDQSPEDCESEYSQ